jgi:hypothetical protein
MVRRLGGLVFGTAGALGLLLCVAALVGCWVGYFELLRRVDQVFGRGESALAEVGTNLDQAGARLRQSQSELVALHDRGASVPPAQARARRAASRKTAAALGPRLGEARELVVKATELGLVANGILEALGELPIVERAHIDMSQLQEASTRIREVTDRSARLADLLEPETAPEDDQVAKESSGASEALHRAVELTEATSGRLNLARQRIEDGHSRIRQWLDRAVAVATVVLVWLAAGQLSLLIHGRTFVRR